MGTFSGRGAIVTGGARGIGAAVAAELAKEGLGVVVADPRLPEAVVRDIADADHMLVLYTAGDDTVSRLRAGEVTSAVLLAATTFGLATCPLSEPLEIPEVRAELRTDLLDDSGYPQMIVRTGWAATSSPLSPTPRRPLDDVVTRL